MTGDEGLWVRSDVTASGTYGVTINVGEDHAWTLTADDAQLYATTCVRRATEADHDTAVLRLLVAAGVDEEHAAGLLAHDLRPDRVVDHGPTEPLQFHAGIAHDGPGQFRPFLSMHLKGTHVGQLTPADLRDHAMGVLNVLAAADLDAALLRCLVGVVGTDDDRARAMVGELMQHWPAEEQPRRHDEGGAR